MAFPFYGADGTNGTVAATNGSPTVTGTGTNWLTNNAVPTAGGYAIKMPDDQVYGIKTCTAEGTLTLVENYAGSDISGGSYYIMPMAAAIGKLLNDVATLLNSSNFSQIAGLSPSSGDFLEFLSDTWATRTPVQALTNLLNSASEVSIASASTCDIGAATSPKVQITGTTTITGLGSQINAVRFVRFGGALTLTHNASSLILLGGVSRVTASGDTGIYISDSSGNWREGSFQRAASDPGDYATKSGTETLTNKSVSAISGSASLTINNSSLTGKDWAILSNTNSGESDLGWFYAGTGADTKITFGHASGEIKNVTNSYGAISDAKLKQDVVLADTQWNDLKAIGAITKKYRLKSNPTGPLLLGLIAQDVEAISPGLVGEDPDYSLNKDGEQVATGTTTKNVKYSILYMKAVKALAEALVRIEILEDKVASLSP